MLGARVNDIKPGHRWTEGEIDTDDAIGARFLSTPERRIKRKLVEILITFQLEHRFTKKQIFAMYANEINLGQRGSFSIDGFGEASQAFFGKDIRRFEPRRSVRCWRALSRVQIDLIHSGILIGR